MAFVKKTLADLKQKMADRHDSGVLPTDSATLSFWTRLLNDGVAYCADKLRLEKSASLTTASGTIALPDDFLIANRVYKGTVELIKTDKDENHDGLVYWITGNQTDGFYLNTTEDETYTVWYSFKPEEMDSNSDVCIITDPLAVVAYAYSFLRKSETDPIGDADKALEECDIRLAEIQSQQNINDNFNGFQFYS